jgi:hypothetical protein
LSNGEDPIQHEEESAATLPAEFEFGEEEGTIIRKFSSQIFSKWRELIPLKIQFASDWLDQD